MNDATVQMIAQAIIANTKVIQSLIDALPHDTKVAVGEKVTTVTAPAPVAQPVVAPTPAPAPVVATPAPVAAAPAMPAPPTFAAPVAAPAATGAPFSDGKGLIDYVMGAYKALGPQKGAQIQTVLTGLNYQNINDVKPEHYGVLFAGIEALK
jgi:hypothetical protein